MIGDVLLRLDELLRSPKVIADRIATRQDLRPLVVSALVALVAGAGTFGAVLATSRGGVQFIYSAVKLPLAILGSLCLCVPAFYAIARALGRDIELSGMVGLALSAAGRAALVLLAMAPAVWFMFDRGIDYHFGVLVSVACYGLAGLSALRLVANGIGLDTRGLAIIACCAAVLLPTGAQTAWLLRPFIGRPAQAHVPFLRHRESSFVDAVWGTYRTTTGPDECDHCGEGEL